MFLYCKCNRGNLINQQIILCIVFFFLINVIINNKDLNTNIIIKIKYKINKYQTFLFLFQVCSTIFSFFMLRKPLLKFDNNLVTTIYAFALLFHLSKSFHGMIIISHSTYSVGMLKNVDSSTFNWCPARFCFRTTLVCFFFSAFLMIYQNFSMLQSKQMNL